MLMNETPYCMTCLVLARESFPPFRADVKVLFAKMLAGRGHRIDWLLQAKEAAPCAYRTSWLGNSVWVGRTDSGASTWSKLCKHVWGIAHDLRVFRCLRTRRYDLLIVKDKFLTALPALLAARVRGVRFVYWLSYPLPEAWSEMAADGSAAYPRFYRLKGVLSKFMLYRVILPRTDMALVQSEQMKQDLAARGIDPTTLFPVSMGIDLEELPVLEEHTPKRGPQDEKLLVYLGSLIRLRKLDFLLRVFHRVLQAGIRCRLQFVGGSEGAEDEAFLKAEMARLGVRDRCEITGFLPREEAWKRVQEADVCLSPYYPSFTLNSTSPTKLIEYMALGKAVVANEHPEQARILAESRAGLCVPWDEQAFADAILTVLRNPDEAQAMGRRGRQYVERERSYAVIAEEVEALLLRLCRGDMS